MTTEIEITAGKISLTMMSDFLSLVSLSKSLEMQHTNLLKTNISRESMSLFHTGLILFSIHIYPTLSYYIKTLHISWLTYIIKASHSKKFSSFIGPVKRWKCIIHLNDFALQIYRYERINKIPYQLLFPLVDSRSTLKSRINTIFSAWHSELVKTVFNAMLFSFLLKLKHFSFEWKSLTILMSPIVCTSCIFDYCKIIYIF